MKKHLLLLLITIGSFTVSKAQYYYQDFSNYLISGNGWDTINHSAPLSPYCIGWWQGFAPGVNTSATILDHTNGDSTGYACANFRNVDSVGNGNTISNFLLAPATTMTNYDTIAFWTTTHDFGGTIYPDNLQVLLANSSTSDVGLDEISTGQFINLLLEINPNFDQTSYPVVWTQYELVLSGLSPGVHRVAFRYYCTNGGLQGANSGVIGIDDYEFIPNVVPNAGVQTSTSTLPISVYPNPTTDNVTVNFNSIAQTSGSVLVTDVTGKVVLNYPLLKGNSAIRFATSTFQCGDYFVTVNINGKKQFAKFTKI